MSFESAIQAIVKKYEKMIITSGTVTSVRENDCDVKREEQTDLTGVRFTSTLESPENSIKITPKVGSYVLCGIIENDPKEAVVLMCGEIDSVFIKIGDAEFLMKDGKFKLKNNAANLKEILDKNFETLVNATITTPGGPGQFSPQDVQKFEAQKEKTNQLFI